MGIFHDHTKQTPANLKDHVKVMAKETFEAYIDGIEKVRFVKGELHPRSFMRRQVEPWIQLGRFSKVMDLAEAMKAEDKAKMEEEAKRKAEEKIRLEKEEAARQAQARKDQEEALEREAAEKQAIKDAEEKPKTAGHQGSGAQDGEALPTDAQLEAMNKETLIGQARAEGVKFEETWAKKQIREAILAARAAK